MCFDFMVFLGEDRTTIRRKIFKFMLDNLSVGVHIFLLVFELLNTNEIYLSEEGFNHFQ